MENFDPNKTPKKQILSAQIDLSKFERATDEEKRQQDVMSEVRPSSKTACASSSKTRWRC